MLRILQNTAQSLSRVVQVGSTERDPKQPAALSPLAGESEKRRQERKETGTSYQLSACVICAFCLMCTAKKTHPHARAGHTAAQSGTGHLTLPPIHDIPGSNIQEPLNKAPVFEECICSLVQMSWEDTWLAQDTSHCGSPGAPWVAPFHSPLSKGG